MIKAVIVDFDDTLSMNEEACFEMENEALALMGRPPMSREIHKSTWGQYFFDAIQVRSPGVNAEEFLKKHKIVHDQWIADGRVDTIDATRLATMDALLEQGRKLYILTNRTHREIVHLLAPDHDLASRITTIYYHETTEFHKPDPRVFDSLLSVNGFERQECVYVGDAPSDAVAAKKANMHFIASLEGAIRTKEDFEGLGTDVFIEHFADLPAAVAFLDKNPAVAS
ncbi:MAG TPA: HAD-IA family hydrolase [Candidatus Pristimantibacillus sp.]|nr:HAD-IA family hydrolase [Candidatus Pristimantibacillus sp.]